MNSARFDGFDLTGRTSVGFENPERVLIASRVEDVVDVLTQAEAAVAGGSWAVGYVAYEATAAFNPTLSVRRSGGDQDGDGIPPAWFAIYQDRTEPTALRGGPRLGPSPYTVSAWTPSIDEDRYHRNVHKIRERIAEGQLTQVNYALRLDAALRGDLRELYRDIVLAQRGDYGAYLDTGRHRILSASPERFFKITGSAINVRPMKGAAGRGRWAEEDRRNAGALVGSERDRTEHLTIVEQMRSDLETITEPDTVVINRLLDLQRFETVWQLVSDVSGDLREGTGIVDVFRALFPAAAVTGDPKAAAMEVIDALEDGPRGIYGGAIGYLAPGKGGKVDASFSVAIRTIVIDTDEGIGEYMVGAGITDRSPLRGEYDEAGAKTRILTQRRPDTDLYEEIRWEPDHGFRWIDRHLERLADSAEYFGFRYDEIAVRRALDRAVSAVADRCAVRVEVDRFGSVSAGVTRRDLAEAHWLPHHEGEPVACEIDPEPVSSTSIYRFHNTTARFPYEERGDAHGPASEVLLINERGEITGGTGHNVVARIAGTWVTPPLASGCLPGVLRGALLDEGVLVEEILRLEDVGRVEEIALIDSVDGWQPAHVVGG